MDTCLPDYQEPLSGPLESFVLLYLQLASNSVFIVPFFSIFTKIAFLNQLPIFVEAFQMTFPIFWVSYGDCESFDISYSMELLLSVFRDHIVLSDHSQFISFRVRFVRDIPRPFASQTITVLLLVVAHVSFTYKSADTNILSESLARSVSSIAVGIISNK